MVAGTQPRSFFRACISFCSTFFLFCPAAAHAASLVAAGQAGAARTLYWRWTESRKPGAPGTWQRRRPTSAGGLPSLLWGSLAARCRPTSTTMRTGRCSRPQRCELARVFPPPEQQAAPPLACLLQPPQSRSRPLSPFPRPARPFPDASARLRPRLRSRRRLPAAPSGPSASSSRPRTRTRRSSGRSSGSAAGSSCRSR